MACELFGVLKQVKADECNQVATLIEAKKIYLTQPLDINTPLSFNDYIHLFERMAQDINAFKDISQNYTTEDKIQRTEPLPLHPFDDEHNIIHIKKQIKNVDAINECSRHHAELITVTNSTRQKIVKLMRNLDIQAVPFQAIPVLHSLYTPKGEHIETPQTDASKKMKIVKDTALPYIRTKEDGSDEIAYAAETSSRRRREEQENNTDALENLKDKLTTEPPSQTIRKPQMVATIAPFKPKPSRDTEMMQSDASAPENASNLLCFKKNNIWDLPTPRQAWTSISKGLQHAANIVEKIILAFRSTSNLLGSLDRNNGIVTQPIIKVATPSYIKDAANFLHKFKKEESWEKTTPTDIIQFERFISNIGKMDRHLIQNQKGLLSLRNKGQTIELPIIDEHHWLVNTALKDTSYGIVGPAVIRINESISNNPNTVTASIKLRIFDRQDPTTIFKVQPNVIHGNITTVNYLVSSRKYHHALLDEPSLAGCITREEEEYDICRAIDYPFNEEITVQQLLDCGIALRKPEIDSGFSKCPTMVATNLPTAYRAQCKDKPTAIVNSDHTVRINYVCDGSSVKTEDLRNFPAMINTGCELQEIDGDVKRTLIPQLQHDLFQYEAVQDAVTPLPTTTSTTPASIIEKHLDVVIGGSTMAIVVTIAVIFIIVALRIRKIIKACASCCHCICVEKKQRQDLELGLDTPNISNIVRGPLTSSRIQSRRTSPTTSERSVRRERLGPITMF